MNNGPFKLKEKMKKHIKLFFDYPKHKDGFMGRENRRYWLILKNGKKKRITEKQYLNLNFLFDGIQA